MPPKRNDRGRLHDIITWGTEAREHHGQRAPRDFIADRQAYLAALYCIQVVGEAAWSLTDTVKARSTVIPWPLVAGMRHRLVHEYGRTDPEIVHKVVMESLPPLILEAQRLLDELNESATDTG